MSYVYDPILQVLSCLVSTSTQTLFGFRLSVEYHPVCSFPFSVKAGLVMVVWVAWFRAIGCIMITLFKRSSDNDFILVAVYQGKFSSAFHSMEKAMTMLSSTCPLLLAPEVTLMWKLRDQLIWNIQVLMLRWLILP